MAEVAASSIAIDLFEKKEDYRRAGVEEYLVLCVAERALRWFLFKPRSSELKPDGNGVFKSRIFPGLWIDGPNLIQQSGTYTWKAQQRSSPGPIAYQWSTGQTSQTISRNIVVYPGMPEYAFTVSVTVRDTRNGKTRTISKLVVVRDPYQCPTCF